MEILKRSVKDFSLGLQCGFRFEFVVKNQIKQIVITYR